MQLDTAMITIYVVGKKINSVFTNHTFKIIIYMK